MDWKRGFLLEKKRKDEFEFLREKLHHTSYSIYPVIDEHGELHEIIVKSDFSDFSSLSMEEQKLLVNHPLVLERVFRFPHELRSNVSINQDSAEKEKVSEEVVGNT
jgi:hypothetical protein